MRTKRPLLPLLGALLVGTILVVGPAKANRPAPAVTGPEQVRYSGRLLVKYNDGVAAQQAQDIQHGLGAKEVDRINQLGVRVLEVPAAAHNTVKAALLSNPAVAYVEEDEIAAPVATPNDPYWPQQWGPVKVSAPAAWDKTTGSSTTVVAVIDTGVALNHPDLQGKLLPGKDFGDLDDDPTDNHGHGSMVAGVIGAKSNNGVGAASYCWNCMILPVKVMNANNYINTTYIINGIIWATDNGADVINISLRGSTYMSTYADAIKYAHDRNVVVVAGAGNSGNTTVGYPAAYPDVIGVANTTETDTLVPDSTYGSWVKMAAPGSHWSTDLNNTYSNFGGTSCASAVVAGIAALAISAKPTATNTQVEQAMFSSAKNIGNVVAHGRVDANAAVTMIATGALPTPVPTATANLISDADWLVQAAFADGAIGHYPDRVAVRPYLSHFAAIGLAHAYKKTGDPRYADTAWRWLSWYQSHMDPTTGYVTDYNVVNGVLASTGGYDSTDSYAGMFLVATYNAHVATGDTAKTTGLRSGIVKAVSAIESTQQADGLTWDRPDHKVKYLMDQSETYAGLRSAAWLATNVLNDPTLAARATNDADRLKAGVESLWNESTGSYDWAKHTNGVQHPTDWSNLYSDSLQQVWAVAFGLVDDNPTRANALLNKFNTTHPNWDRPGALVQFDGAAKSNEFWAVGAWAFERQGNVDRANQAVANIRDAAIQTNRAWPFHAMAQGQVLFMEAKSSPVFPVSTSSGTTTSTTTTTAPAASTTSTTTTTTTAPTTTTTSPIVTSSFTGSFNPKGGTHSYPITVGSGQVDTSLRFTKASSLTLKLVASNGATVATASGSSPVKFAPTVSAGSYKLVVSSTGRASYTVSATHARS